MVWVREGNLILICIANNLKWHQWRISICYLNLQLTYLILIIVGNNVIKLMLVYILTFGSVRFNSIKIDTSAMFFFVFIILSWWNSIAFYTPKENFTVNINNFWQILLLVPFGLWFYSMILNFILVSFLLGDFVLVARFCRHFVI